MVAYGQRTQGQATSQLFSRIKS
uniref:Uncharacterized protein n=1 Tax=Rhizophora mucronata TaxID=61149 RepID=A0A2P2Q4M9_RHIMU